MESFGGGGTRGGKMAGSRMGETWRDEPEAADGEWRLRLLALQTNRVVGEQAVNCLIGVNATT